MLLIIGRYVVRICSKMDALKQQVMYHTKVCTKLSIYDFIELGMSEKLGKKRGESMEGWGGVMNR